MRHNERNYDSDNRDRGYRSSDNENLSNYQSRYQSRGNYYGMPDQDSEYRGVSSQGRNYGGSSSGPVGGYGASSWRSNREQDNRHTQGQMHQQEWGGSYGNRQRDSYNYGSSGSQGDHYRYGDPNPYMNYQRQGGYERNNDDWRREGDIDHTGRRYARQENSYRQTGHGRRFDQYGQDERYNYAHGPQDGRRSIEDSESLDDRYYDRGEHSRSSSSDNDYGSHYGSNYEHRNSNRDRRDDHHESTRLARDSRSGHDDSPSRSPRGYGYPSGPDYSASSPITNYGPGVRGHQK